MIENMLRQKEYSKEYKMKRIFAVTTALASMASMAACARISQPETEQLSGGDMTGTITAETTIVSTTSATTTTTTATTTTETTTTTQTGVIIPDRPQTDTEVRTGSVGGSAEMINGIMVVDAGTDHARALEVFYGSMDTGARYAGILNDYKAELGEDVNVYCMVAPTSSAYYMPDSEAENYGSQLENYNNIAENLDGVIGVPVYSAIGEHISEPLYSRTDFHWQPLAAYYAGKQFAAYANVPYPDLSTYESVTREGYLGAFYSYNEVEVLAESPEPFTYYKPANLDAITSTYYDTWFDSPSEGSLFHENNAVSSSYTVFVGYDDCILEVDTDVDNDRVLVIFKDSYGNALVPFLTQSFSKIYLCDFRYFNLNAPYFIREVGATDLLFAMSSIAVTSSGKVDLVESNLWQ